MNHRNKRTKAFTLIELLTSMVIILIVSVIMVVTINPNKIFTSGRDSIRANDMFNYQNAISRYMGDTPIIGASRSLNDFGGYNALYTSATTGTGGSCPNGANGINAPVNGAFNIDTVAGNNVLNFSPLTDNAYLQDISIDPLTKLPYQACIDTNNNNQLVLFSPFTEQPGYYKSKVLATQSPTSTGALPQQIPGLSLWLDASKIQNVANGQTVAKWFDSSGNGNHAFQNNVGQQPVFVNNVQNSLPGIQGNGINQLLTINNPVVASSSSITIFMVVKTPPSTSSNAGAFFKIGDTNTGHGVGMGNPNFDNVNPTTKLSGLYEGVRWLDPNFTLQYSTTYLITFTIDNVGIPSFYVNGNLVANLTGIGPNTPINSSYVLGYYGTVNRFSDATVLAILVYNKLLTSQQIVSIQNYLNSQFKIY